MKKLPLLLSTFFIASSLSTSMAADLTPAGSEPYAKTEPALACLVGLGPSHCAKALWGGDVRPTSYCATQSVHGCLDGPLERVDYLGTNAAGADIYGVHYNHSDVVYVIAPPGLDGKTGRFWFRRGLPTQVVPHILVQTSAADARKITVYRRPWD